MIVNQYINRKSYSDMLYDSRPVSFSEYMSNKYDILHHNMYEAALNAFIEEWLNNKQSYIGKSKDVCENFIQKNSNMKYCCGDKVFDVNSVYEFKQQSYIYEIMPSEYWQPAQIIIMTKFISLASPNLKWTVDLSPWWNMWQSKSDKTYTTKKISKDGNWYDAKITRFDYMHGKATLYSKTNDQSYEVPFDYLSGDEDIDDSFSLANTFTQKMLNS